MILPDLSSVLNFINLSVISIYNNIINKNLYNNALGKPYGAEKMPNESLNWKLLEMRTES
jgi:hypothetical protein